MKNPQEEIVSSDENGMTRFTEIKSELAARLPGYRKGFEERLMALSAKAVEDNAACLQAFERKMTEIRSRQRERQQQVSKMVSRFQEERAGVAARAPVPEPPPPVEAPPTEK
ncbi:MAG: hypothetical protein ACE5JS_20815 [Nitrospinota bacterium]